MTGRVAARARRPARHASPRAARRGAAGASSRRGRSARSGVAIRSCGRARMASRGSTSDVHGCRRTKSTLVAGDAWIGEWSRALDVTDALLDDGRRPGRAAVGRRHGRARRDRRAGRPPQPEPMTLVPRALDPLPDDGLCADRERPRRRGSRSARSVAAFGPARRRTGVRRGWRRTSPATARRRPSLLLAGRAAVRRRRCAPTSDRGRTRGGGTAASRRCSTSPATTPQPVDARPRRRRGRCAIELLGNAVDGSEAMAARRATARRRAHAAVPARVG